MSTQQCNIEADNCNLEFHNYSMLSASACHRECCSLVVGQFIIGFEMRAQRTFPSQKSTIADTAEHKKSKFSLRHMSLHSKKNLADATGDYDEGNSFVGGFYGAAIWNKENLFENWALRCVRRETFHVTAIVQAKIEKKSSRLTPSITRRFMLADFACDC